MKGYTRFDRITATLIITFTFFGWTVMLSSAQIRTDQFEEVTASAGISHVGDSYGIAWGDFNADGWPDVWIGNHALPPKLYLNNRDGTFTDITNVVHVFSLETDTHGVAWADFNRDGYEDLAELVGGNRGFGSSPKLVYVNKLDGNGGRLMEEQGATLGLDYPRARGRTPLWFDFNGDGRLDVFYGCGKPRGVVYGSAVFKQVFNGTDWVFENANVETGFSIESESRYAVLSDLTGDGKLDLVCHGGTFPSAVFDIDPVNTRLIRLDLNALGLPLTRRVRDSAIADFNGDLRSDLFLIPGGNPSDVVQISETRIEAGLYPYGSGIEVGFSFRATGQVTFELQQHLRTRQVFIGAGGMHPNRLPFVTLSPDDPNVVGIMEHQPGVDEGIFIGYDPATMVWTLVFSTQGGDANQESRIGVAVETQSPISDLTLINVDPDTPPLKPRLLLYNPATNRFEDRTQAAGLYERIWSQAVVTGDFDNDGDLDLYIVCAEPVLNSPNILYENLGDGTFRRVPNAGGAEGSDRGRGDTVGVADYDRDGFLDLLVVNGQWPLPFCVDGPTQLFHNRGNGNHWLEIDLVGIRSNPHGIGARVVLTTPDGRSQLREQSGGMHSQVQNDKRLHFGLGSNTTAASIEIRWPSGIIQTLTNVNADQILTVVEPSGFSRGGGGKPPSRGKRRR